jgi:lipoprotein LprG
MAAPRRVLVCLSAALLAGACSSGGSSGTSPETLVSQAKATLDATNGLHFTLTSGGAPKKGTVLVGGSGDVARPSSFQGKLKVQTSGLLLSVDVISVDGKVWIRPPLTLKYSTADPHKYGFSDPGKLLDPQAGISSLLSTLTSVTSAGHDRFRGEKLEEVDVTLPGSAVADVLTSADKTQPVHGRLGINPSSHELRRAVLTGPFLDKNVQTTFTIVLDNYGEHPTISAPS